MSIKYPKTGVGMVQAAMSHYGVREIGGDENHPVIMGMFRESGHGWVRSEVTPWCSAAMCTWAVMCGSQHPGSLRARSWMSLTPEMGWDVLLDPDPEQIQFGDALVFWRGTRTSSKGHIALDIGRSDIKYRWALGGNQGNSVCIRRKRANRVIARVRMLCGGES